LLYATAHLILDRQERRNEIRSYLLRCLAVLKPEAGDSLLEMFPEAGVKEPEQTSEEVLTRTREIRDSPTGTAGKDEESARIIKDLMERTKGPRMDHISAPEDMVSEGEGDG